MKRTPLLFVLALLALPALPSPAAEPVVTPEDLPRVSPTPPEEAVATFEVKPGFRIDLVASEPLLVDPVAIAFDEDSRMYVVEMIDYSERRDERLGRVRLLEDSNGDGRFDTGRVFAEGLAWPTAVICYDGGIFVGASPDIIWLKDTTGDGKADERRTVFTGFGAHSQRLNVQALLNNFTWGVDNRIHGATSRNGGRVEALEHPSEALLDLRSRDFSFDPRTLTIRAEAGGGQHGMSFDTRGRKFVSSNSNHIQALMYEERYAARNPHYTMPRGLIDIPVDGPAAEVYRISPDEPWRVIRTRWRVEGTVPGIIEGGGRPSGYFTGASGGTLYRGDALPASFLDNVFVADSGSNLVHRKIVRTEGVQPVAERPEDEQKVEFIASRDVWFRPVDFANAPDGGLYILDMYREVIEHPWSLPEPMKQYLDLNSGNDRGRIYRVVPEDFEPPAPVRLGEATTSELVATLGHDNGWHRSSASRLLYERRDPQAIAWLEDLLESSGSSAGRMRALYSLAGMDAIKPEHILAGLDDPDDRVRQHAVRLSETFQGTSGQDVFMGKLLSLSADRSPLVRYQLAFSLGEFNDPHRISALAEIMTRDLGDPWIEAAVLSSLAKGAGDLFALLSAGDTQGGPSHLHPFLVKLTGLIASKNDAGEIGRVLHYLTALPPERSLALVYALGSGMAHAGQALMDIDPEGSLVPLFAQAAELAQDSLASTELRSHAIAVLGLTSFAESGATLLGRVNLQESREIQIAALRALDHFPDEALAAPLLDRWDSFSPHVRNEVLTLLLRRSDRTLALLRSIESGLVLAAEIPSTQADFLATHSDMEIRELSRQLLARANHESREDVLMEYLPSLKLEGNAARGEAHYQMLCVACHRSGDQGYPLGPDLRALRSAGKDSVLVNLIDPNREVAPNYVAYRVETRDGQSHFGIIVSETARSVTLRHGFGTETVIPRSEIAGMQSQGRSIMPEGLEAALDLQKMADLLEFIITGEEQESQ